MCSPLRAHGVPFGGPPYPTDPAASGYSILAERARFHPLRIVIAGPGQTHVLSPVLPMKSLPLVLVSGSSTRRVVPAPRGLSRKIRPPSASTRSLRPARPVPPVKPAPPAPSSLTATRRTSPATSTWTLTAEARACLAALVSASAAM